MKMSLKLGVSLPVLWAIVAICHAYPEQGRFTLTLNKSHSYDGVAKNLYNNTKLYVRVSCSSAETVKIGWVLRETHVRFRPSSDSV
jgi:hypothetical protein